MRHESMPMQQLDFGQEERERRLPPSSNRPPRAKNAKWKRRLLSSSSSSTAHYYTKTHDTKLTFSPFPVRCIIPTSSISLELAPGRQFLGPPRANKR